MQPCIEHEVIVDTNGGYASSINRKVERPYQTINNIVWIKLISCGHQYKTWCFYYQYTIWLIYRLINRHIGTDPIVDWYKHNNISYNITFTDLFISECKIYIINYKQGKNALDPYTNTYPYTFPPAIYPYLIPPSTYGLFTGYPNSTNIIIYFDPKTRRIRKNFHCCIDEYYIKSHQEESISIGDIMIQEYPSGVYQPGTPSHNQNTLLIQPSLKISDSPFASSELLTLEPPLPPSGTHMNITILDDIIFYITYIYQVPSTTPTADQFPMETRWNIYVFSIDNYYPSLASTAVQLLR